MPVYASSDGPHVVALVRVPALSQKGEHYYCVTSEDHGKDEKYVVYLTEGKGSRHVTSNWSMDPYKVGEDSLLEVALRRPSACRRLIINLRSSWRGHRVYYRGGVRPVMALSCHPVDFELEFIGLGRNRHLIVTPRMVDFGADRYAALCQLMEEDWLQDDITTRRLLRAAEEFCLTLGLDELAQKPAASPAVKVPQMYIRTLLWWHEQFLEKFVGSKGDPSVVLLHELESSFYEAADRLRWVLQQDFRAIIKNPAC